MEPVKTDNRQRVVDYNLVEVVKEWKITDMPDDVLHVLTSDFTVFMEAFADAFED